MTVTVILNGFEPGAVNYFPYNIENIIKLGLSYPITLLFGCYNLS